VLYDELWDQPPPESTGAQRRAAAAARNRAARNGWPAPMGLDDGQIDDPGYRPRAHWRPADAACTVIPSARHASHQTRQVSARSRGHRGWGR
jgi:hypothetical protein